MDSEVFALIDGVSGVAIEEWGCGCCSRPAAAAGRWAAGTCDTVAQVPHEALLKVVSSFSLVAEIRFVLIVETVAMAHESPRTFAIGRSRIVVGTVVVHLDVDASRFGNRHRRLHQQRRDQQKRLDHDLAGNEPEGHQVFRNKSS